MALGQNSHECIFVCGHIGQVSSFKKSNGKIFFVGLLQGIKQESFFGDLFLHFLDLFFVVCGSSDDLEENGFVLFFGRVQSAGNYSFKAFNEMLELLNCVTTANHIIDFLIACYGDGFVPFGKLDDLVDLRCKLSFFFIFGIFVGFEEESVLLNLFLDFFSLPHMIMLCGGEDCNFILFQKLDLSENFSFFIIEFSNFGVLLLKLRNSQVTVGFDTLNLVVVLLSWIKVDVLFLDCYCYIVRGFRSRIVLRRLFAPLLYLEVMNEWYFYAFYSSW